MIMKWKMLHLMTMIGINGNSTLIIFSKEKTNFFINKQII
jgi:hypothetical protein